MNMTLPPSQLSVHHLALLVNDLEASENFYREILGLEEEKRWLEEDSETLRSIWLRTGENSRLMLERATSTNNRRSEGAGGWHLFALRIEASQREAWREYLNSQGIGISQESSFSLYVEDPEGNKVALSHWPHPAK